jgi:peptidyl-prolyl cis-trans isomerase SurA
MRIANLHRLIVALLACLFLAPVTGPREANAQNIIALVNDEPITSFDVDQRQRWIARTNGYGDRLKAALTGDAIKERFRQMMIAANPRSQAEAQQVAERIKKQLVEETKRHLLTDGAGATRKAAIEALIEDKLKLQAAKKLDIKITDKEVEEALAQRAGISPSDVDLAPSASTTGASSPKGGAEDGGRHRKGKSGGGGSSNEAANGGNTGDTEGAAKASKNPKLEEFYQQFEKEGINRKTIQEIIRAQLAWRDAIRKQYGPRISSILAALPGSEVKAAGNDLQFDVRILRLAVDKSADQKAVSQRILEAENLKEKFTSCADLAKQAKLVADATIKSMDKATLESFPKDIQPLILKAGEGQMTPPVLVGDAIESYAVCKKGTAAKANASAEQKPDLRQQEYDRFSRRYLQQIKQSASIDYRGS